MRFFLSILSEIYSTGVNIRNSYYDKNTPQGFGFPVISVGGIRAGGSGKTPICDFIIKEVLAAGKTPVLFSRGYKRLSKQTEIVPPFAQTSWETVGDEPLMLKVRNPKLWLAVDKNRNRAAKKLLAFFDLNKSDIVGIMDDGFQEREFYRSLDVVILAPKDISDTLLPLGRLREPISSLKRADIIVSQEKLSEPKYMPRNINVKFATDYFVNAISGEKRTKFDEDVLAFCGIARPYRFIDSIKKLTGKTPNVLVFRDHHRFSDLDYKALNSAPQEVLLTTQKDFMRLNAKKTEKFKNLWYLSYEVEMSEENREFLRKKILEIL